MDTTLIFDDTMDNDTNTMESDAMTSIEKEAIAITATVKPVSSISSLSADSSYHSLDMEEEGREREKQGEGEGEGEGGQSPDFSPLALADDLTPLPDYKAAGTTKTDFDGLLPAGRALRLREDLKDGCGGQLWPAGMTLARYMLRYHAKDLAGKRILELGAGGGLVGLAVARGCELGGNHPPLCITDQMEMFSLMKHNIALNELEGKVEAMLLNWGEPLPAEIIANPPDVILAADCVYFEPAFPLLQRTLADLLALRREEEGSSASPSSSAVVYFCFKKRRRADMQFLKQIRKRFCVAEISDQDDDERPVWSRQGLFMFAITAKESPASSTAADAAAVGGGGQGGEGEGGGAKA